MDWTEQMQELARSWTDLQKSMMAGWTGATGQQADGAWAKQWQEAATKGMEQWLGRTEGVQGSVSQRLLESGRAYQRFFEFFTEAMKNTGPQVEKGVEWATALRNNLETLQNQMGAQPGLWMKPESAAALGEDVQELWRLFLGEVKAMTTPWTQSLDATRGHVGDAMAGDHRAMIRMFNLFTDTFESTLGKFVGAPAIGYSREYQEKLMKAFDTWVEMKKAEAVFNTEMVNIGFGAMRSMADQLREKAEKGETIESPRELFDLWVNTAERFYFDATGTEAFAKIQASLVNAAMHYRVHERTLLEVYQKALHLPTRREIDDGYRHMHEMRKQVKQLKRSVTGMQATLDGQPASLAQQVTQQLGAERRQLEQAAAQRGKQLDRKVTGVERQLERKIAALEKKIEKLTGDLKTLKQPAAKAKPAAKTAGKKPAAKRTAAKAAAPVAKSTGAKEE